MRKGSKMQEVWNAKFKREDFLYGLEANNFIKENTHHIKKNSRVICLGEGEGRNALYLAKLGFKVEALDASDVGLSKLQKKAQESDLAITIRHTYIENWNPHGYYDAIFCSYMHLPKEKQKDLLLKCFFALNENAYFIAELFSENQIKQNSFGPKDKNLLYNVCEIYDILKNVPCKIYKLSEEIVTLNEGVGHKGEASVIRVVFQKLA
jgi:2-polyprenyl-3-methyl-5-hydroxy-6-metoxy-1,4-benzoquinol methylase